MLLHKPLSSYPSGRLTRAYRIHSTALLSQVLALKLYILGVIHFRSFIKYFIRVFRIHAQNVVLLSIFQPWMNWNCCCCRRKVCCENRSSREKEQGMSFTLSPLFTRSNVGIIPAPLSADKMFIEGARVDWIDLSDEQSNLQYEIHTGDKPQKYTFTYSYIKIISL